MTKYTSEQRKELARLFTEAKKVLAKNYADSLVPHPTTSGWLEEEYICHALERVGDNGLGRHLIRDRIYPYSVLTTWVRHHVVGVEVEISGDDMQTYRHRWLDALIEEFSN